MVAQNRSAWMVDKVTSNLQPNMQGGEVERKPAYKLQIADFENCDKRNFVKACNNVCFFSNKDLQIYFSIVDVGFFFKNYVLLALKRKKGLDLYELALCDHLLSDETLLPIQDVPSFFKIQRFNSRQKLAPRGKRIAVEFEDGESWKLYFKNKDMLYNWMDLLEVAAKQKSMGNSSVHKQLKRNYDYQAWRARHPFAQSNFFESFVDFSTLKSEIEEKKEQQEEGETDPTERRFEHRDRKEIMKQLHEAKKMERIYKKTLDQIERIV